MRGKMDKILQKRKTVKEIYFIAILALAILVLLGAAFAQYLCPYDPNAQDLALALQPPGGEHLLGTDRYGRDMLSRIIVGAKVSVFSALTLVAAVCAVGTALGVLCGFCGGWLDEAVMRLCDMCLAFPGLVLALAVAALLGGGIENAAIALGVVSWPKYARLARGQTMTLKQEDFIAAARLAGDSAGQLIRRHILPNLAGPVLVMAALDIGTMMMELAGLSFLGLGALPPTAEWGSMMSDGRTLFQTKPWVMLGPGAAIFLTVAVFNLLADALRDRLDIRSMGNEM